MPFWLEVSALRNINASQGLLGACTTAGVSDCSSADAAASNPQVLLSAAVAAWGGSGLSPDPSAAAFSLTLSGPTLLVLRARSGGTFRASAAGFSIGMGGVACPVLSASSDGLWAVFRSPNSSDITHGGDSAYAPLTLTTAGESDPVTNATTARGASLACPPFCPGTGVATVPIAVDTLGLPSSFTAAVVTRPASGTGAPTVTLAQQSQSSLGFFYAASCSRTGLYTDPASGACTNASNPASELCAFGSGDSCTTCPTGGLCPGGSRVWPRPGFYASTERSGVLPCPPPDAAERCLGWDAASSAPLCGPTYLAGSYLCQACAVGSYSNGDGTCRLCPKSTGEFLSRPCLPRSRSRTVLAPSHVCRHVGKVPGPAAALHRHRRVRRVRLGGPGAADAHRWRHACRRVVPVCVARCVEHHHRAGKKCLCVWWGGR